MSIPALRLDPSQQPWMQGGGREIITTLAAAGIEARYVGGCVRDAILGKQVQDIDLAVAAPPDQVTAVLQQAGIKVVPTGLDHGTVTAVMAGKGYEITSLRHDLRTDGRHAEISFTTDWQADAARRDFTFNALYATAEGEVADYFNGQVDLIAGRVRFIGDAVTRIREDYLRILRFFRFYAWYGVGEADPMALAACTAEAPQLTRLSFERVWQEIAKLLLAKNPVTSWRLMLAGGVLTEILPEAGNLARLEGLLSLPAPRQSVAVVRLAALLPDDEVKVAAVVRRLKMSKRDGEALLALAVLPGKARLQLEDKALRRLLYEQDPQLVHDALLLLRAGGEVFDLDKALGVVKNWDAPVLPVQGVDLLQRGIQEGPRIGEILRLLEAWWMAADFRPDREECLKAAEILAQGK